MTARLERYWVKVDPAHKEWENAAFRARLWTLSDYDGEGGTASILNGVRASVLQPAALPDCLDFSRIPVNGPLCHISSR